MIIWIAILLMTLDVVLYILITRAWVKASDGGWFRVALIIFFASLAVAFAMPLLRWFGITSGFLLRFGVLVVHTLALLFLYFQIYKLRR